MPIFHFSLKTAGGECQLLCRISINATPEVLKPVFETSAFAAVRPRCGRPGGSERSKRGQRLSPSLKRQTVAKCSRNAAPLLRNEDYFAVCVAGHDVSTHGGGRGSKGANLF